MEKKCLIIDVGSGYCKIGFSGDLEPSKVIPTVIGEPSNKMITEENENINNSQKYFGQKALDKYDELTLTYPIQKGQIIDFDNLEKLFNHIFQNELEVSPKQFTIFLTEPPLTSKKSREKISEIFFEKFNIPSLFISNGAVLSLYGACKYSGYVLDCGFEKSTVTPIGDGFPYNDCIKQMEVGGKDVCDYLFKLLCKKHSNEKDNRKIINDIIEKYCYASLDTNNENQENKINYTLPDNTLIPLDIEKYMPAEILFHPEIIEKTLGGVANLICSSASEVSNLVEDKIESNNLVICGGASLFKGFGERLRNELGKYYGGKFKNKFNIVDINERRYLQWIGASIYSLMKIFNGLCTTSDDYKNNGIKTIHNKCFY